MDSLQRLLHDIVDTLNLPDGKNKAHALIREHFGDGTEETEVA